MKRTTTSDGTRVAWVEGGRGPSLVLLHSLGADSSMWSTQATALEGHYRVLRVDMRGHGESDAPVGPYSIQMLGEDLLEVAGAAGLDRFHLGGISIGGQIALWVAIHHAERLQSVILSNTAARIGSEQGWSDRIAAVRERDLPGISEMVVGGWFSDGFSDDEARSRAIAMFEQTDPEGYIGCCRALANADLRPAVGDISLPTLVVAGEADRSTPPAEAEWLHRRIAGSRLEVMDGCAHLPNLEQPEEYNALLTDWLSQASSL